MDLLLRRDRELLAIEVKSQSRFSGSFTRGLRAIGELPGVVRRILVYGGNRRLKTPEGIEVWPLPTFLRSVEAARLWP